MFHYTCILRTYPFQIFDWSRNEGSSESQSNYRFFSYFLSAQAYYLSSSKMYRRKCIVEKCKFENVSSKTYRRKCIVKNVSSKMYRRKCKLPSLLCSHWLVTMATACARDREAGASVLIASDKRMSASEDVVAPACVCGVGLV